MGSLDMLICATMSATATVLAVRSHGTNRKDLSMLPHLTPEERFWAKVTKTPYCWIWPGPSNNSGYGTFTPNGRRSTRGAHRYAYELVRGPIPVGMEIDHVCRNKLCVNPSHLEVVTHRENNLRAGGWATAHANATHCPQGHPYDLINTQFRRGRRYCRECVRAYDRGRRGAAYWREYRRIRREQERPVSHGTRGKR